MWDLSKPQEDKRGEMGDPKLDDYLPAEVMIWYFRFELY